MQNLGKWTLLDEYIEKNFKPIRKRTPDDISPKRGGKLFVARKATPFQMEPITSRKKPKEEMAMLRDGSLEDRLNQMDDTFQEKLFELNLIIIPIHLGFIYRGAAQKKSASFGNRGQRFQIDCANK